MIHPHPWRAVYFGADGVWADGGPIHDYIPAGFLRDPVAMLMQRAAGLRTVTRGAREGVLIVDATSDEVYGRQGRRTLSEHGWHFTGLGPWTTFTQQDSGVTIHLGCLPSIDADRTPLFHAEDTPVWTRDTPATITARLADYHRLTGVPWRMTAGVSGCAALRSSLDGARQPLWHWHPRPGFMGADPPRGVGNVIWRRELDAVDEAAPFVVGWDLNAAYLSAMTVAEVSWGAMEHTGTAYGWPSDDPTRAGYWLIEWSPGMWPWRQCPAPIRDNAASDSHGRVWVTGPVMRLLYDQGITPVVHDSWMAPEGRTRRPFGPFIQRLRSARLGFTNGAVADDELARAIKATWAETVGMFNREGGSIHRPDWFHTIVDTAATNLIRKVIAIGKPFGRWPVEVATDAVYYPSTDQEPPQGMNVGAGLGQFKQAEWLHMGDYLTERSDDQDAAADWRTI